MSLVRGAEAAIARGALLGLASVLALAALLPVGTSAGVPVTAPPADTEAAVEDALSAHQDAAERSSRSNADRRRPQALAAAWRAEEARKQARAERRERRERREARRKEAQARAQARASEASTLALSQGVDPNIKAFARARTADASQWSCLDGLWTHESNWRHGAVGAQTSHGKAYGIPQMMSKAPPSRAWRTSPEKQVLWGLSYIENRYKTPCGALAHFDRENWY